MAVKFNETKWRLFIATTESGEKLKGAVSRDRIDKDTVPKEYHAYQMRSTGKKGIYTIENNPVVVNFHGTVIFNHKIKFPNKNDEYITVKASLLRKVVSV